MHNYQLHPCSLFVALSLITTLSCNQPPAPPSSDILSECPELTQRDRDDLLACADRFMADWHAASAAGDAEKYFGGMPAAGRWIGTDATENWDRAGIADYGRDAFAKGRGWAFKTLERNLYTNETGTVVWFDELLDTAMGVCRGSGVLTPAGQDFDVQHYVFSVTVPNDFVNETIQRKAAADSTLIATFKDF